ncbi:MAG TPA: M28 family peptidase [Holophagaceae bacterium]|nr:M28 family peptidase [Holophagaceae bacterium]
MRIAAAALAALSLSAPLAGQAAKAAAPKVSEAAIRAHLAFLSDDLLEGRGTGQRGGDLAVLYLRTELARMGLKPANGDSYLQPVKIAGVKTDPAATHLAFTGGTEPISLAYGPEMVVGTGTTQSRIPFDAPLVFVGYGISAPEEKWDDYKGADGKDIDCKGKLLVMMVNDPQPTAAEPNRFGGKSLTYYGRWTYKYEEAARRGAAGVILIHTDATATYGWSVVQNSNGGERFQLADSGQPQNPIQGWVTNASAARIFKAAGQDLDGLRAQAETRGFHPVALNVKLSGELVSQVRTIDQANVAGIVPGTDPKLKDEVVIYTAHWDHLGIDPELIKQGKDGIYNGAVDNGSGSATVLAMAEAAVKHPAKRSQMFLFVCAEEQGLLGSAAYGAHPLWPADRTACDLNLDAINWVGPTRDIGAPGADRTTLGATAAAVAKSMGLVISKPTPDIGGGYFRSDHFSLAKDGIPAFSVESGEDFLGDAKAQKAKADSYEQRYHQPSDAYDPAWDLRGMAQMGQFTLNLGYAVADAPGMPSWKPGDPFGAARAKGK